VIANVANKGLSDLMVGFKWMLTDDQWNIIATDFAVGKAHVEAQLTQKLHFWEKLPWQLCGMASPDVAQARQCAVRCLRLYDSCDDAAAHHRISVRVLQRGSELRLHVEQFVAGESLAELPSLETEVARLAFIPVCERIIEARASNLRHALREHQKLKSGKGASLGLRLPELFNKIAQAPRNLDDFMVSVLIKPAIVLRSRRSFAKLHHPAMS
jgi:hypothetical protein